MKDKKQKQGILHNVRQGVMVTLVLLLLCGFLFPVVLSGLSAVIFPSQANGSLVEADGATVGAKLVGQEFTEDYFLWGRPSQYHYNTYYEVDEDTDGDGEPDRYYNDGSTFGGLGSGSANYAPSNPALVSRVESDIISYLMRTLRVERDLAEDAFADLPSSAKAAVDAQIAYVADYMAEKSGEESDQAKEDLRDQVSGQIFSSDNLLTAASLTAEDVSDLTAEAIAAAAGMTTDELYEAAAASVTAEAICQAAGVSKEQVAELTVPTLYGLQKSYVAEAAGLTLEELEERIDAIPADLMTASGSGLDPHVSPASAEVQIPRIVKASGLTEEEVRKIIEENTTGKTLGVFGEETVNVLGVNLDIAQAMGKINEVAK